MAETVRVSKRRLKSLDEFEPPPWREARTSKRPILFGLLLCLAVMAGAAGGLIPG